MLRGCHGDESLSGGSMVVDNYTAEALIRTKDEGADDLFVCHKDLVV